MYQLIQLSDLECDYVNPHDACRNVNRVVVRRAGGRVDGTGLLRAGGMGAVQWRHTHFRGVLCAGCIRHPWLPDHVLPFDAEADIDASVTAAAACCSCPSTFARRH